MCLALNSFKVTLCMQCVCRDKCSKFFTDHVKELPKQKQLTVKMCFLDNIFIKAEESM